MHAARRLAPGLRLKVKHNRQDRFNWYGARVDGALVVILGISIRR